MPFDQHNISEISTILSPEEVTHFKAMDLVRTLMERGKVTDGPKSHSRGWTMSEVIDEVARTYGSDMADFTRRYIVEEICGMRT